MHERLLEGIVAKLKYSTYNLNANQSPWIKIKNRNYSQARDRWELFDGFRRRAG